MLQRLDATIVERFNDYELVLINGGKGGLLGFVHKILWRMGIPINVE